SVGICGRPARRPIFPRGRQTILPIGGSPGPGWPVLPDDGVRGTRFPAHSSEDDSCIIVGQGALLSRKEENDLATWRDMSRECLEQARILLKEGHWRGS